MSLSPTHHPAAEALSVKQIVEKLHSLGAKIFDFVRDWPCTTGFNAQSSPGSTPSLFHAECSFLPSMLKEVNAVVENVQGPKIDEFESRKVSGAVV